MEEVSYMSDSEDEIIPLSKQCREYVLEHDWEEGFCCVLKKGHDGDHIAKSDQNENFQGTDTHGRKYDYEFHWRYVN